MNSGLFLGYGSRSESPNILYAATGWVANANAGSVAIYKSTNFGLNWNLLTTGIPGTEQYNVSNLQLHLLIRITFMRLQQICSEDLHGIYKTINAGIN